jgi:hypothetical protein
MARVGKDLHAPSVATDLRGLTGRSAFPCVYACWRGCRSLTCLHGTHQATGVQDPPKLSVKVKTWNVVPQVLRPSGQANRKASCWRSGSRCLKKRMPFCNGRDIECNILGSVRRLTSGRCLFTRKQKDHAFIRESKRRPIGWCAL